MGRFYPAGSRRGKRCLHLKPFADRPAGKGPGGKRMVSVHSNKRIFSFTANDAKDALLSEWAFNHYICE
jgi:hypothetical protein